MASTQSGEGVAPSATGARPDVVAQPAVVLDHVSKDYVIGAEQVRALVDVSLTIPRGSQVAVIGKSGAGKSTLLHIIGTLDRPSSGSVILDGTLVSDMPDTTVSSFRNNAVGFVFQMHHLLPEFSALENVMMPGLISGAPARRARERATQLLDAVGLAKRYDHRPGELSGGEQQRVAIARALLMAPSILLCDEPTGNLDQKTSDAVQDLLLDLCHEHGMTMVLVTHDMDLAHRLPGRVVMEDGRIIEGGDAA